MRKKYANKSQPMKFFHMYTGYIVLATCIAIVVPIWFYFQTNQMFFENFTCLSIVKLALNPLAHESLNEVEHTRFHEILEVCFDDKQFFEFEHEWGQ